MRGALLLDAPLLFLVALYAITAFVSSKAFGIPAGIKWTASWRLLALFTVLYLAVATLLLLIHTVVARKQSLRRLLTWKSIVATLFSPPKLANFATVFLALSLLMPVFLAFKASIPTLHPFSWDVTFMEWDRWLHLGRHPFELLQPLLGSPRVTKSIDALYFLWIHVMWLTVVWQGWHGSRRSVARSQFLFAFAACWILVGTITAILLSSAGPIYYGRLVAGPDPYVPLMEYLRAVNSVHELRVLNVSEFLWTAYQNPGTTPLGGISAMPSMHVAIAMLMALLGFSINRWVGWGYSLFAAVVLIGSVHLAWHYAIDGYVSLIFVPLIWWAAGRASRAWHHRFKAAAPP